MRPRVIRDPIYGYITLPPELARVVDHPLFQRLRGISQTSLTSSVFPSISGSRFNHGLGAMHLAARGWDAAWEFADEETCEAFIEAGRTDVPELPGGQVAFGRQVRLAIAAGALLHDVGHPPFSHALEDVFREWALEGAEADELDMSSAPRWYDLRDRRVTFHEFAGDVLVEEICDDVFNDANPAEMAVHGALRAILSSEANDDSWAGSLHGVIAGEVDVDRLDYLIRDSHSAGTEFGAIDYQRLVDALELHAIPTPAVHRFRIAPGIRARSAVETLLVQRLQSYQWVHFHPRVVGFNIALRRAFALSTKIAHGQPIDGQHIPDGSTAKLLRAFRPNLNYWDPEAVDLRGAAGLPHVDSSVPEHQAAQQNIDFGMNLEIEVTHGLNSRGRRLEIQAMVDDATVIDTLKRAYFAASSDASLEQVPALRQVATYARAALFRHKNFIPAWKTSEEYRDAVDAMGDRLRQQVVSALEKRRALEKVPAGQRVFEGFRDRFARRWDDDRVFGFNVLVDMLLSRPAALDALRHGLNRRAVGDAPGFWELYYAGYGLRKAQPDAVELYVGEKAVPLAPRSPLVRAIAEADNSRIKLFAFFFYPTHDFGGTDAESAPSHRERISGRLEECFPDLVEEALENAIR